MIKDAIHMSDAEILFAMLVIRLGGTAQFTEEETQDFIGGRFEVEFENSEHGRTMVAKVRKVDA